MATGQINQVETLLGSGAKNDAGRAKLFAQGPIGRAQITAAQSQVSQLSQRTSVELVDGMDISNLPVLKARLQSLSTEYKVGGEDGAELFIRGDYIFFCLKPNYYWACASTSLKTGNAQDLPVGPAKEAIIKGQLNEL